MKYITAKRINDILVQHNMTIKDLAVKTGIKESWIEKYVHSKIPVDYKEAIMIGKVFGMNPRWFFGCELPENEIFVKEKEKGVKEKRELPEELTVIQWFNVMTEDGLMRRKFENLTEEQQKKAERWKAEKLIEAYYQPLGYTVKFSDSVDETV